MVRRIYGALAALSLAACVAAPFLYLQQAIGEAGYKNALAAASVAWFVFGSLWVRGAGRAKG